MFGHTDTLAAHLYRFTSSVLSNIMSSEGHINIHKKDTSLFCKEAYLHRRGYINSILNDEYK